MTKPGKKIDMKKLYFWHVELISKGLNQAIFIMQEKVFLHL